MIDVRAVLFDLDGTLLDTLEDVGRSANETLEELGFPPHPIESYRQFIGDGLPMLFRRALPVSVDAAAVIDQCVGGFRKSYGRGWNMATRPYPGIPELLDGLVTRSLGIAVLSNKPTRSPCNASTNYCRAGRSGWFLAIVRAFLASPIPARRCGSPRSSM